MAKVMLVNFGREAVKVEVQAHDERGRFKAVAEHKLKAGRSKTFVVEHGQSIQVIDPNQ